MDDTSNREGIYYRLVIGARGIEVVYGEDRAATFLEDGPPMKACSSEQEAQLRQEYVERKAEAEMRRNSYRYHPEQFSLSRGMKPEPPQTEEEAIHRAILSKRNYKRRVASRERIIKELILNNFAPTASSMVTLTFDPKQFPDSNDIAVANKYFKQFIQRMNERYASFAYVAVPGLQSNEKRYFHFHMICNLTRKNASNKELGGIWRYGRTWIQFIDTRVQQDRWTRYCVKNTREAAEGLQGKKGYLSSRGLRRSIELKSWSMDPEQAQAAREQEEQFRQRAIEHKHNTGRWPFRSYITKTPSDPLTYVIGEEEIKGLADISDLEQLDLDGMLFHHFWQEGDYSRLFPMLPPAVRKQPKRK